jgi:hypothetical protein
MVSLVPLFLEAVICPMTSLLTIVAFATKLSRVETSSRKFASRLAFVVSVFGTTCHGFVAVLATFIAAAFKLATRIKGMFLVFGVGGLIFGVGGLICFAKPFISKAQILSDFFNVERV